MFKNKVAIVTGASSGIGAEIALMFASEGANLIITYKENKTGAKEVASKIMEAGSEVIIIQADLINELDAKNVIEKSRSKYGKIDVLVNNAGGYIDGDEWSGTSDIWTRSLQQNLVSVMNMSKYAIEIFQEQKLGVIVNISSRHSIQGQFGSLSYAAAKAGVVNITQAYAKLLAPYGRANAVSPGAVNAGYWLTAPAEELKNTLENMPHKKLIETKDVAEVVLFLASNKAKNVTGQNILVDGRFNLKLFLQKLSI